MGRWLSRKCILQNAVLRLEKFSNNNKKSHSDAQIIPLNSICLDLNDLQNHKKCLKLCMNLNKNIYKKILVPQNFWILFDEMEKFQKFVSLILKVIL